MRSQKVDGFFFLKALFQIQLALSHGTVLRLQSSREIALDCAAANELFCSCVRCWLFTLGCVGVCET